MITLNHVVYRNASVDARQFRDYWLGEHARELLELAGALGIGKIVKCETRHEDEANLMLRQAYRTATDAYDFVDHMVINDLACFKEGLARPEVRAAWKKLHERTLAHTDCARSDYWFSIEHRQVLQVDHCVATEESAFLKAFYVARYRQDLTLAQAQLHWNACHGSLARQFPHLIPLFKYVQGHRVESKVCDELKAVLGGGFADSAQILGQAEAWLDRRSLPGLASPEAQRMMRLLTDDIDLFIDAESSHAFAAKEYVLLDHPMISECLPRLFSVD